MPRMARSGPTSNMTCGKTGSGAELGFRGGLVHVRGCDGCGDFRPVCCQIAKGGRFGSVGFALMIRRGLPGRARRLARLVRLNDFPLEQSTGAPGIWAYDYAPVYLWPHRSDQSWIVTAHEVATNLPQYQRYPYRALLAGAPYKRRRLKP